MSALVFKTRTCSQRGHREFTLVFREPRPVPQLEEMLLSYFERAVARGTEFKPGQIVQVGWAMLRLKMRDDGTLGVEEPEVGSATPWVESVDRSLMEVWYQKEVVSSLGLTAPAFPQQSQSALVCNRLREGLEAYAMSRSAPARADESGWFIGCAEGDHDHDSPANLRKAQLAGVAAKLPFLTQFLALPTGTNVHLAAGGRVRPTIFIDGNEASPKPGSYLAALASGLPSPATAAGAGRSTAGPSRAAPVPPARSPEVQGAPSPAPGSVGARVSSKVLPLAIGGVVLAFVLLATALPTCASEPARPLARHAGRVVASPPSGGALVPGFFTVLAIFCGFAFLSEFLMARMSRWSELFERYPARDAPASKWSGCRFFLTERQSGGTITRTRVAGKRLSIWAMLFPKAYVAAGPSGLYLKKQPWNFMHRTIAIPWDKIVAADVMGLLDYTAERKQLVHEKWASEKLRDVVPGSLSNVLDFAAGKVARFTLAEPAMTLAVPAESITSAKEYLSAKLTARGA